MKYKDLNGIDIRPGDYIVYSALWDRSAILKYGVVTRLEKRKGSYYSNTQEVPTLRVVSVDRSGRWNKETNEHYYVWELQNKGKEITLGFLDRLLVVPKAMVPEEAFNLLVIEALRHEGKLDK